MRFSVPPLPLTGNDVATFARRAEELGFDGFWTLDSAVAGRTAHNPMLDGLQLLSYVAAITKTPTLGVAVIVLPRRNAALLAKELATVDQLSGGRVVAGVGLGVSDGSEAALGFPTDRHVRRMTETVKAMRARSSVAPPKSMRSSSPFSIASRRAATGATIAAIST